MNVDAVIFDLDGTLVESAPGILASFDVAFQACNIQPVRALTKEIIGPPLRETIESLTENLPSAQIDHLVSIFKKHYDTDGCKQTHAFLGITNLLRYLSEKNIALFIATNKRHVPTQNVIKTLKWEVYFKGIFSLDSISPVASNKGALIRHITDTFHLSPSTTLYIGDREEDRVAAENSRVQFFFADWGYKNEVSSANESQIGVDAFIQHLEKINRTH